jgi:hypothetical protein
MAIATRVQTACMAEGQTIPDPLGLPAIEADPRYRGALKTMIVLLIEIDVNDGGDAALWICSRDPNDI